MTVKMECKGIVVIKGRAQGKSVSIDAGEDDIVLEPSPDFDGSLMRWSSPAPRKSKRVNRKQKARGF